MDERFEAGLVTVWSADGIGFRHDRGYTVKYHSRKFDVTRYSWIPNETRLGKEIEIDHVYNADRTEVE